MSSQDKNLTLYEQNKTQVQTAKYTIEDAISEFDELKNIALSCFDKNGNPNISVALKAVENKAKIAGLYSRTPPQITNFVKMGDITIDGEQLKLDIGEEYI